ncbi:MAG: hypothetical protein AAGG48_32070 [Planctomycetota bacterium]
MIARNILFCFIALACPQFHAEEVTLPNSIPPFALGDFCVLSMYDRDGDNFVKVEYYGWRSREVKVGDDVPTVIDGKVMYPDPSVRDTYSPTRNLSVSFTLDDSLSVWDQSGEVVSKEKFVELVSKKKRAVMLSRRIEDSDKGYLHYFGDDILFIQLDAGTQYIIKHRRAR